MAMRMVMPARPMMMMRVPIHLRNLRRRHATIHRRTVRHLQLNRRMLNPEVVPQLMVDPRQQILALR